jgi:hypothetical protein
LLTLSKTILRKNKANVDVKDYTRSHDLNFTYDFYVESEQHEFSTIETVRDKLGFILSTLIPEDKQTFLCELGNEYVLILLGETDKIAEEFWTEWYDVAEFEKDREALQRIDQMLEAYKDDDQEESLSWEELCQITNSNQ